MNLVYLQVISGSIMDCYTTARGSIPVGNGAFTELRRGQQMGVTSLYGLPVEGTQNTNNVKHKQTNHLTTCPPPPKKEAFTSGESLASIRSPTHLT